MNLTLKPRVNAPLYFMHHIEISVVLATVVNLMHNHFFWAILSGIAKNPIINSSVDALKNSSNNGGRTD